MDVAVSLALLPLVAVRAVLLLVMNPILNQGPLFFFQIRMGRGGRAFVAYKFRSEKPGHGEIKGPLWPGYRARLGVRPGISGYAQTEVGYAQSLEYIQKKVWADHY
ncbi:sugar transferase [Ruegeria arenilitoris]|uniref:sugar transferase n=1 Tax=Ruegeria arenilitoris TaxID=1173585 RepID=UPI00147FBEC6|nr:sugar transferase [Ruegeria arenilitoris]